MPLPPLAIVCSDTERLKEARALAAELKLPLLDHEQGQFFDGLLIIFADTLQISDPTIGLPLQIEFASPSILSRIQAGKKQPLPRACGLHKRKELKILDCTAGLGQDMVTLAALGAEVTATERNPIVRLLLKEALQRPAPSAALQEAIQRCHLDSSNDAFSLLEKSARHAWDVIYLDPMFTGYKRKALPKKSMQIFARLCGEDSDADDLLLLARKHAAQRVVVKRGPQAPLLADLTPDHQLKGSRARFDIYLNHQTAH